MNNQPTEIAAADRLVAEARRDVHESLTFLAAPEADRVRALIADLETAVEGRTAIRGAARTASGQQPETHACGNCDGIDPDTCLTNPDRAPAVGQPAEAQAADEEAHPPRTVWRIEWWRKATGKWIHDSPSSDSQAGIGERLARTREYNPNGRYRLVRETTTWTVEGESR